MTNCWKRLSSILVPLLFIGCYAQAHYAPAPPPLPPPPPLEPPPGAPPPSFSNVDPAPAPSADPPNASPGDPQRTTPVQPQTPTGDTGGTPQPQTQSPAGPLPALPSQAPLYGSTQPAPTPPTAAPNGEAPSATEWVRPYPQGQWVYTTEYGWIWVPSGAETTAVEGVPYTYIYTPRFGWTWYLSPWGWGPYHYGVWVARPWRPRGWHYGWVARPHVVVRLGHRHR